MKLHQCLLLFLLLASIAMFGQEMKVTPSIVTLSVDQSAVALVHLTPGYATAVRVPDEINSVVLGDPTRFKAEHSDAEPRLAFFKPLSQQAAETNALIIMKSGQEVSLHLFSSGVVASGDPPVDFVVDYTRQRSLLIGDEQSTLLVRDTRPLLAVATDRTSKDAPKVDPLAEALKRQQQSDPAWRGKSGVVAALGEATQQGTQMLLSFSVLNQSDKPVELLPPQMEMSGIAGHGHKQKRTKAEPVALTEYRITTRRLAPGDRADGVVAFERPSFKESSEKLQLEIIEADQVDRPIVLPAPFIAMTSGGAQ